VARSRSAPREVASLAGVGIDYYRRLERGNVTGVSNSVLEALSRALQLDHAERAHIFDLAHAANPAVTRRRRRVQQRVRPAVQRILDSIGTPALVRNARVDYLAANRLGYALYAPLFESGEQPANSARFTFLDQSAIDFYVEWERVADDLVAHLRSEAGRHPHDRGLYYGRFYRSVLVKVLRRINAYLVRWAMAKYKRLRRYPGKARGFLVDVFRRQPSLFAHWRFGVRPDGWTMGAR
jgi:transcriptional regulator with XRE-family HTH domain